MMRIIILLLIVATITGCSVSDPRGELPYQVGAGSAIFAGSAVPAEKTSHQLELYFGHHVVLAQGDGRDCCYKTAMGIENSGKPSGGVRAIWQAVEYGEDKVYLETHQLWVRKVSGRRFYYAAALPSQVAAYPVRTSGHRSFGIYVSAGKVAVGEKGLPLEYSLDGNRPSTKGDLPNQYVFGRDDTLYYKILSHGQGVPEVADDPSPWRAIPGIEITEAQYKEIEKCSPGRGCRWLLSSGDADLTPEQRDYVDRHPLRSADMKRLTRKFERSRRQRERWL